VLEGVIRVGVGATKESAPGALYSDVARKLVDEALLGIRMDLFPIRCLLLLATADWCDPTNSVSAIIRENTRTITGYDVPLVGGSMVKLYCSKGNIGFMDNGIVLVALCSTEMYVSVGGLEYPYRLTKQERSRKLSELAANLAPPEQTRLASSAARIALGILPGFLADDRGNRLYLDSDLYTEIQAAFGHRIRMFGGSAANAVRSTTGYQFVNDTCLQSGLALAVMETGLAAGSMMGHGFQPCRTERVSVDSITGGENNGYDVSVLDGKPAALRMRELASEASFPLGRPVFGLPCGDDFTIIQGIEVPAGEEEPVRLNRRVSRGDRLYVLNATAAEMFQNGIEVAAEALSRTRAGVEDLVFVLEFTCTARFVSYERQGMDWGEVVRQIGARYPGVPLAGALCAGEFGVDRWNRARSNSLSVWSCCFADRLGPESANREFQRKLLRVAAGLPACETPAEVMEAALKGAIECGAAGGQICLVEWDLGYVLGYPYGAAAIAPESGQDWDRAWKETTRELLDGPETPPPELARHVMPVVDAASPNPHPKLPSSDKPEDMLSMVARTRYALFVDEPTQPRFGVNTQTSTATRTGVQIAAPLLGGGGRVNATMQLGFPPGTVLDRERFALWVGYSHDVAANLERAWAAEEFHRTTVITQLGTDATNEEVGSSPWPEVSCQEFMRRAADLLGADSMHIRVRRSVPAGTSKHFRLLAAYGPTADLLKTLRPIIQEDEGSCGPSGLVPGGSWNNTLAGAAPRIASVEGTTNNGSEVQRKRFFEWARTIGSTATLPLGANGGALGALVIDATQEFFFTFRRKRLCLFLARTAAEVLRARRLAYYREVCNMVQEPRAPWSALKAPEGDVRVPLRQLLERACGVMAADWAAVFSWHPAVSRLVLYAACRWYRNREMEAGYERDEGWVGSLALREQGIDVTNSSKLGKYRDDIEPLDVRDESQGQGPRIGCRLMLGSELIGVLVFGYYPANAVRLNDLEDPDYEFLHDVGEQVQLHIAWAKRNEDQAEIRHMVETKEMVTRLLAEISGPDYDLAPALRAVQTGFQVEHAVFYHYEEGTFRLRWTAAGAPPSPEILDASSAAPFLREAVQSKTIVALKESQTGTPESEPTLRGWPDVKDLSSLVAVPALCARRDVHGVLVLVNRLKTPGHPYREFGQREQHRMADIASLLGAAICHQQTYYDHAVLENKLAEATRVATTGLLAAIMAHDIKAPLARIRLGVEVLRGIGSPDVTVSRVCDAVVANCDEAVALVESARAGNLSIASNWDMRDVVSKAIGVIQQYRLSERIRFEFRNDVRRNVRVRFWSIVNALVSLLVNAWEALEDQGELKITTEESADGNNVLIRVYNSRPTLPEDKIRQLFVPGFSTKKGHSGLGLSSASKEIRDAGGEIAMRSPDTGGVEVTVSLPVAPESPAGSSEPEVN
jgi:signal transduction histidine kinase